MVSAAVEEPTLTADRARRFLDDFRSTSTEARETAAKCRRYYDGDQLDGALKTALRRRKQPEMPINYMRAAINGIVGVVIQNPTDPRAYARTPDKQDAADVASMTLRYVADCNHLDQLKADKLEEGCIEGAYAAIVECGPDQDVTMTDVRWEEFFYDIYSRRADFMDAKYLGIAKWMYADHLATIYTDPGLQALFNEFGATGNFSGMISGWGDSTWLDRPDTATPWVDKKRKRLMVAEVYYQEGGVWYRAVYCAGGMLEHGKSAYLDDNKNTACPIIAGSAYVDASNFRYGVAKDMLPIQDGINMRESKLMHLLNSRQVQQTDANALPIDVTLARTEAARPDGVLPMGWGIVSTDNQIAGQAQLLQEAKQEILRMSPNPAIVGRGAEDASGRAVQIRQQAGLTELARVLGRFQDWELRLYRRAWSCCRQFWTAPKWIRVNDDDGAPKYVMVNDNGPQPVVDPQTGQPMVGADGQPATQPPPPMVDPQTGQPAIDPQTGQPKMQVKNHIAEMDVDIIVDTVPESPDLQAETDREIMKLLASNPLWMQSVPFSLALDVLWQGPQKRITVQKFQEAEKQHEAAQAQAQQAAAQAAQQKLQIDGQKTASETAKNVADARKTDISSTIDAMQAHVGLNQALAPSPGDQTGGAGVATLG